MKTIAKKFDSLTAFASWLSSAPLSPAFSDDDVKLNGSENSDKDFFGTENYEEANNLMLHGWAKCAKRVNAVMASGVTSSAPVRRVVNSVVGFAPNVPAAIAGRPLNMRRSIKVNQPRRVVSLVWSCGINCDVTTTQLEAVAGRLFNVICGLERSGVRVELYVMDASAIRKISGREIVTTERIINAVKIKSADQPLNVLKMCYPVVHPSFCRRHGFKAIEKSGTKYKKWVGGYGAALRKENELAECAAAVGLKTANILSYYSINGKSEEDILKMIK